MGVDQVKRFKGQGFTGLKFPVPVKNYDDPEYLPIYAEAEKPGIPCYFHAGIIARRNSRPLNYPEQPATPGRMKPCMPDTIAVKFPKLWQTMPAKYYGK